MNKVVCKVVAYITYKNNLLVFKHSDHPEAGIQVPAGTMEENETSHHAVMREAFEETSLSGLILHRYLGTQEFDMTRYGRNERQNRAFFHLLCTEDPPYRWQHQEQHRSDGHNKPITFEFYWVHFPEEVPELAAGQGALLEQVKFFR